MKCFLALESLGVRGPIQQACRSFGRCHVPSHWRIEARRGHRFGALRSFPGRRADDLVCCCLLLILNGSEGSCELAAGELIVSELERIAPRSKGARPDLRRVCFHSRGRKTHCHTHLTNFKLLNCTNGAARA